MRKRTCTLLGALGIIVLLVLSAKVAAMPPHPDVIDAIASGKIAAPYALSHRAEILSHGVDSPSRLPISQGLHKAGQTTTTRNVLCVLVEFSDKTQSVEPGAFDTLMFVNQVGSVRHYYNEVSYNTFDIVTVNLPSTIGWLAAPQTYAYYCNGENGLSYSSYPQNAQKLAEDVINLIDPVVNFANYDNDGDGYVDGVVIVHTGPGAEFAGGDPNLIWSHQWCTRSPMTKDGKFVWGYSMMPEYWSTPGDITLGVFVHEIGHLLLGLPDLYDTDYSSRGLGKWSLMAGGSWNGPGGMGGSPAEPDAWCRVQSGFASASNVVGNVTAQSILDVESNSSGSIFRLWTNGTIGDQYFLIENRQRSGYDTYLPNDGLLIWHVDESVPGETGNDNEWYPGHTLTGHYLVALEQADNLYFLEKNFDYGNSGDPFPGSTAKMSFSGVTGPSSDDYLGNGTLVAVGNISGSRDTMTADLTVSLAADVNDYNFANSIPKSYELDQNFPNPFNPETVISFGLPHTGHVNLSVYNVLGEEVEELFDDELPAGRHEFVWSTRTRNGASLPSGIYFYRLLTQEVSLTRKMLLLK